MSPSENRADDKLDFDDADAPEGKNNGKKDEKAADAKGKNGKAAAKPKPQEDDEEELDEEAEGAAEKKSAVAQPITSKGLAKPIHLKKIKDAKLKALLEEVGPGHHRCVGYLNPNDILFPAGFKTKHFHIGWKGNVVVNKCPKCGHRMSAEEAIKGFCSNEKTASGEPCDFNAIALIDEYDESDIAKL
jgi:hypothetical protein